MTKAIFRSSVALAALTLAALALTALPANAQDKSRPKKTKDRLDLLESEVDELENNLKDVYGADAPDSLRSRLSALQAKMDEIAMQMSELNEKAAASEEAATERDARLDDLSEEVKSLWKDIESFKEDLEQIKANPPAGYKDGFFIGSIDGKFKLTINGFVRPYYSVGIQKVWDTDQYGNFIADDEGYAQGEDVKAVEGGFGMANARLALHAQILDVIHGEFEIDYGTLTGTVQYPHNARVGNSRYNKVEVNEHSLRFLDVYGEYAPIPEFNVRVGQFKVPFDQESQFDSNWLTFTSRSLITRAYPLWGEGIPEEALTYNWNYDMQRAASFGRDTGLELKGTVSEGMFNYAVGVFNGAGDNVENDNRDILVALRLSTEPAGKMTEGMSDLTTTTKPLVSIGAAFAYDLLEHQNLVDPLVTYNSSDVNLTADAHLKWYGVSFLGSIFYRHADHGAVFIDDNGDDAPIDSVGTEIQLAYFNDYTKLEPGFRYSLFDADMNRNLDHIHEITAILSYYPFSPNLKIQAQYRGLFPAQTDRSYLRPWGVWYDYSSEITLMAQVAF